MTDAEKLITLFEELGIPADANPSKSDVIIRADDPGVEGYHGFYCHFVFDDETGKFAGVGVWE